MSKKYKKHEKRQPAPKLQPRRANFTIGDRDVSGIEFDAKFQGEESRLFYIPVTDALYRWRLDLRPERFARITVKSISEKRKASLLAVWEGQPPEESETA
jgi:hypothetical protein